MNTEMQKQFEQLLFTPIQSENDAQGFYYELESLGLLFHPEDDPAQIINKNGRVFTDPEAQALRERVEETYTFMVDPCDYILTLDTYKIADER